MPYGESHVEGCHAGTLHSHSRPAQSRAASRSQPEPLPSLASPAPPCLSSSECVCRSTLADQLVPRLLAQDEAEARGDQPSETRLVVVLHNGVDPYEATTLRDED